ncbi:hypothetical protein FNV43_RR24127 [Rhamnella rubrinervis]|uniref:F-box domain-containing protein n=1 Tax=Rhamnella rubrinervis TaxID=2594499 RepID=A0A8K0DL55_9ROSA|nr:hypothetical protein FNV43_RR24127 [Rhamnella rubrinervis]
MGIGFSFFAVETLPALSSKPGLGDLPEDCISSILRYLDPLEICKLALLNRNFHGASLADFVWESKLPPNYKLLLHRAALVHDHDHDGNNPHVYLSKKDIYTKLCRPNRFDGGTKEVWLDKRWGKVFLSISSKALRITGIDDRRYWNFLPTEESRFKTVAYLQQIWWLEVIGELEFEFPAGGYGLCFRLQLGKPTKLKKAEDSAASTLIKSMVGTQSLYAFSWLHPTATQLLHSVTCANLRGAGAIIMWVALMSKTQTRPSPLSFQCSRLIVLIPKLASA